MASIPFQSWKVWIKIIIYQANGITKMVLFVSYFNITITNSSMHWEKITNITFIISQNDLQYKHFSRFHMIKCKFSFRIIYKPIYKYLMTRSHMILSSIWSELRSLIYIYILFVIRIINVRWEISVEVEMVQQIQ